MANALNAAVAKRWRSGSVLAGSAASAMAGLALWNTYRARKVKREHPPRGRFVAIDGAQLHYLEKGGGQPVVFLHGNVVTAEDFDLSGLLSLASERQCHVVAFDRPGFGYSDRPRRAMWTPARQADLFRQAFVKLGIERPVVGHSLGTLVALALSFSVTPVPGRESAGAERTHVSAPRSSLPATADRLRIATGYLRGRSVQRTSG
jgi:alpha-beta hydrolase superfamily lysophospholipase